MLIIAFAKVLQKFPNIQLAIVGEGEQSSKIKLQAEELNISGSVKFLGFQPHQIIPYLLSAADIAVAPYIKIDECQFQGSPMKLYEYLASGKAIIASNIGQIRNVIEEGSNGLLVPPGDIEALTAAFEKLIVNPRLRSSLGEHAREDAVKHYSWDDYILRLEQLYASILNSHKDRIFR